MAVEQLSNVEDFRAMVRLPENRGLLHHGWSAINLEPLHPFLKEMADDIKAWLRPEQDWYLAHLNFGMINIQRIADSSEGNMRIIAKKREPDKFVPVFHFDATNPPLKRGFLGRARPQLDVAKVFKPDFKRYHVSMDRDDSGSICWLRDAVNSVNVGSVLPLERALEEMNSPYYLGGVTVSANRRYDSPTDWAQSLSVMCFMYDLGDHLRIEDARLRRDIRQFDKKFSTK